VPGSRPANVLQVADAPRSERRLLCPAALFASGDQDRKDPEDVLRSKSRAYADVLRQAPEEQKLAPRKVEQIPTRQAVGREVPKSQSVVRKGITEKSMTTCTGRSDQLPNTGVVKWSRGSMAWLSSEELQTRFPDQEVFLHRSECRGEVMPRQWDRMVFRLMVADGKPKALDARTEAAHQAVKGTGRPLNMSWEEYHESRCKSGR